MDLLRVVLSRQHLEKLITISPSDSFYHFRAKLIIPEAIPISPIPEEEEEEPSWPTDRLSPVEFFCLHGELIKNLPGIIHVEAAKVVAVFLLDDEMYRFYHNLRKEDKVLDFKFPVAPVPLKIYDQSNFLFDYAEKARRYSLIPWITNIKVRERENNDEEIEKMDESGEPPTRSHLAVLEWFRKNSAPWE